MKRPNILAVIIAAMIVLNAIFTARVCAGVRTDMEYLIHDVEQLTERVESLEVRVSAIEARLKNS